MWYQSTHYVFKLIESILKTNIHLHGLENINQELPTLFLPNHFTRFETMLLPYLIHQQGDIKVRSLADKALFSGVLGEYLQRVGTLSTADENRNEIIIGDLMCAKNSWVIYPEGHMVKNKKIDLRGDEFHLNLPDKKGAIYTGSAVIAMASIIQKEAFKRAQLRGDVVAIQTFRETYKLQNSDNPSYFHTHIVPVNITYTPIRGGDNMLLKMADTLLETKEESALEELEIEGNLLLNSEIHIRFMEPINIYKFLHDTNTFENSDNVIEKNRHQLTTLVMEKVYQNTLITLEHLFAVILFHTQKEVIEKGWIEAVLYLCIHELQNLKIFKLHKPMLVHVLELLVNEDETALDRVLALVLKQNILEPIGHMCYRINTKVLHNEHTFDTLRIKNTLLVIYNEVGLLSPLIKMVSDIVTLDEKELLVKTMWEIYRRDVRLFLKDYKSYYSVVHSKSEAVGKPFLLYKEQNHIGVVLVHGYKAAPLEMLRLGTYLHQHGINVYGVRLKGHGTLPEDLREHSFEAWYESLNRGYCALRQTSEKVFILGFSTGGLLALLAASRKQNRFDGVICINSALKLRDVRVNYLVPTLHALRDFLSLFNAKIDIVENRAEDPTINYTKHYIASIAQLGKLMEETYHHLANLTLPILIVQGDKDPVVNPEGATVIYNKVKSEDKSLDIIDADYHVVINKENSENLYQKIVKFIEERASKKEA